MTDQPTPATEQAASRHPWVAQNCNAGLRAKDAWTTDGQVVRLNSEL